jgi:hypothetical protein
MNVEQASILQGGGRIQKSAKEIAEKTDEQTEHQLHNIYLQLFYSL